MPCPLSPLCNFLFHKISMVKWIQVGLAISALWDKLKLEWKFINKRKQQTAVCLVLSEDLVNFKRVISFPLMNKDREISEVGILSYNKDLETIFSTSHWDLVLQLAPRKQIMTGWFRWSLFRRTPLAQPCGRKEGKGIGQEVLGWWQHSKVSANATASLGAGMDLRAVCPVR